MAPAPAPGIPAGTRSATMSGTPPATGADAREAISDSTARTLHRVATAAAVGAEEPRARISAVPPGGPPGEDPLEPSAEPVAGPWTASRSGLTGLRIGGHTCSRAALEYLGFAGSTRGMRWGLDRDGKPVTVRPFRPQPTRITVVGGYWAAQILVLRALAVGTVAVVVTRNPAPWQAFGHWAVGDATRLHVVLPAQNVEVAADPHRPALIVDDAGALEEAVRPGPWQTLLTVLPVLTAGTTAALTEAELVALQRLSAEEAAVAAQALQLTEDTAGLLQMLEPDMLALLGGGADRYVWINPTPTETAHLGMPRR